MRLAIPLLATALLAGAVHAQFTHVLPNGLATTEGNSSNAFPWTTSTTLPGLRQQHVYDSVNFTAASISYPILITRLRFRANATTASWTGGTFNPVTIQMATAAVDHTAVTTTWASNLGPDLATVYAGPVTVIPGTGNGTGVPAPFSVDQALTTPFFYDPNLGDLVIDTDFSNVPTPAWSGGTSPSLDVSTATPNASRVFGSTSYPNANGTTQNWGCVIEITYVPANGLYAAFSSNVRGGASPLTVQFQDLTYTSAPTGVTSWAWDLDGDSVTDSTVQNPTFTYTNCGSYNVSLTTTDGVNPPSTSTVNAYIVTDVVAANFTYSVLAGTTAVQFTDTSVPTPTSWAWDFNGDGVTDSTVQNPAYVYASPCTSNRVTLSASRLCGPSSTKALDVVLTTSGLTTLLTGGNGLSGSGSGNCFDVSVLNPGGVTICGITVAPYAATTVAVGTPITCDVYLTDAAGGYLSNHTNASVWRLVATGSGTYQGGVFSAPIPVFMALNTKLHIPSGTYGMAVHLNGTGVAYTTLTAATTYANADLSITCGNGKSAPFNTTANANRAFNGTLHYDLSAPGSFAGYGFFGSGCTNSLGSISSLAPTSLPIVGQTAILTVDNLPLNAAIMAVGFSKTTSSLGSLPLDLTALGAPGCFARVSADSTLVIIGASGSATWSLTLPPTPSIGGIEFFNQAYAIDPTRNLLGIAVSDAGAGVIGL